MTRQERPGQPNASAVTAFDGADVSSRRTQAGAKRSPNGLSVAGSRAPPFHAAPAGARSAPAGRTLHLPERFAWWPIRKAKVGRDSRAHFQLRPRRRVAPAWCSRWPTARRRSR